MRKWIVAAVLAAAAAPAVAAATPTKPADCTGLADYHALDFWIGDWDTFDSDNLNGASIARAHVDPIARGCAIHELYEQTDGLIGDSILSYDPVRHQWQQTWVTNLGGIMVLYGAFNDGALALTGDTHTKSGKTITQRITWEKQPDGVREWAVMSTDGGRTWTPAFDVLFRKHK